MGLKPIFFYINKMLLENIELVQTAENIAEEKGIEKELVFQAIEKAISKAGKVKYGNDYDIRGNIDRKTGKISLARYLEVKKDAKKLFNLLNNKTFEVKKLVTENNELYGSVKPTEISKIIFEKENIKIKPSQMDLETGIKTIGMFKVNINLHAEIQANILIQVEKLEDNKI